MQQKLCPHDVVTGSVKTSRQMEQRNCSSQSVKLTAAITATRDVELRLWSLPSEQSQTDAPAVPAVPWMSSSALAPQARPLSPIAPPPGRGCCSPILPALPTLLLFVYTLPFSLVLDDSRTPTCSPAVPWPPALYPRLQHRLSQEVCQQPWGPCTDSPNAPVVSL
uniref:Uncharacterized protein n=1 Tax=Knipowitschia caucasica TaxID=637954 RepID=A0AAV2LV87_KNICA